MPRRPNPVRAAAVARGELLSEVAAATGYSAAVLQQVASGRMASWPRIRARLGVVPQEDSLDTELTVLDNLLVYGRYFDLPRAEIRRRSEELLEFMQLTERRDDLVDPLSGGMKGLTR